MSEPDRAMPPLVSALPVLVGLIAAIVAIAAGPAWAVGASLGILVCAIASLVIKVESNVRNYAVVGVVIVAGGLGWLVGKSGEPGAITSAESEPSKTGFINGKWREQEARGSVETFRVPGEGSSKTGHSIRPLTFVYVKCRHKAPGMTSAGPKAYWYQLEGPPPWNSKEWVPTNSFWNGNNVVRGPGVRETDPRVPECV